MKTILLLFVSLSLLNTSGNQPFLQNTCLIDDLLFAEAATGRFTCSPVKIKDSEVELTNALGKPLTTDWYEGGLLYSYNEISYIIDPVERNIIAMVLDSDSFPIKLNTIPIIWGIPSDFFRNEIDRTYLYTYKIGEYTLSFEASSPFDEIIRVWLQ